MSRRKQGNPRHLKSDLSMLFVDDLDTMPARHDTNPAAQDDKHMMEVDEEYGDCDLVIDTQPGTSSSSAAPSGGADGISISSSTDHKPNEGSPRTSRLSGCEETKDTKKQENGLAHNSRQPLDGEPNNNLIKRSIRNGKVGAVTVRSAPSQMSSHKTSPAALVAAQQPVFNTPSKVSTAGGHQTTVLPTDFHAPLSVATGPLGEFPVAGLDSTASNHVTPPRISHHPGIQGAYSGQVTPSSAGSNGSGGAGVNMPNSPAPSTSSVHSNRSNHSEGNSSATKSKLSQPSKARRKNDKILPVADLRGEIYVCPVCTMSLDSQTALTKHIRSHNTHDSNSSTNNECTICGKVLSSQSSLDRHMLVHSGERPFSCKICNMSFTTNGNMHRHARIHKKDAEGSPLLGVTTPNKNDDGSNSARSSNTGSASGTGRKRRLDAGAAASSPTLSSIKKRLTMNDDMTTPRTMIHPTSDHKIMPFPPTLVQQQMQQQQYQMAAFMRQLQTDIASKCEPSVYEDCYLCLQKFATQEHLKEHLVSQHQLPSSESNEHVVSQPEEKSHLTCEICHITYKTKEILNQHVESTHCDNHDNMEDSPCSIQQNTIDSRSNTSSPLPGFEPLSFTEFSANKFSLISSRHCTEAHVCKLPGGTNQQSYPCPDPKCDLKFPCHSAQGVHYKTHRYQSGLACKQCQCGFDDESSYTQHMLRHHVPHSIMKSLKPKSSPDDIEHNTDEEPVLEQEGFLILCGLKRKPTVNVQSNDSISSMAHVRQQLSSGISPAAKFPTVDSHLNLQQQEMLNFLKLQEQQYAMLSANFSANQTQHVFPLASHYPQQDVAAFTDNFNNKSTPSKGMKLPHIVSPPRPHLSSLSVEESDNQIFSCKFCTSSFQELDAYKDHISSKHVGLSFSDVASDICPLFTCESCEFKNASRRHIVNHLRTHAVDSWPFQCRICESAFVNRQSCEKHISNEHGSDYSRSEVQSAVGYNGSLLSAARSILPPQELTCKYCGTSFTAQSSLVHHLLEKRGCLYRPFACLLCSNGFSTRENCTRHIHGQHAEVPLRFIDICIYVTETAEHTSRRNGAEKGNNTRNARLQMPLGTSGPWAASNYISTPPVVKVKQELQDEDHNQPLDFSVKSGSASIGKQSLTSIKVEEPMDLSSGQPNSHQEKHAASMQKLRSKIMENTMVHSSPSLAPPKQVTPTAANGLTYLCRLCAKTFIDHSILQAHIRQQHSDVIREHPPPKDGIITQSRNKPVSVSEIAAAIQASTTVMATHTESNVADQPITSNAPTTIMTSTTGNGRPIASSSTDNTTSFMSIAERLRQCKQQQEILRRARQQQHPRVAHKVTPNRNALVSSDDLSSVHQMMDVTDPANFKAIFASIPSAPVPQISSPTTVDSGSKLSSQPAVTAADDMDTSSIKPVQPSVVLMDNCLTSSPTVPLNIKSDYSSVDTGEPHKKKRNSYAESPHRLQCPYCPRAFPWISSLNRHLLTHTGQKPFKCPKCPVMFSTKSNRERHLIRKHGLNVHDPATRQMMDRPFKCHMCVFSSFASAGNLMKHYLDKHPEAKLPEHVKREFSNETLSQARHEQLIAAAAKANGTEAVKSELLRDEESGGGTEEDDEDDYMEEDNVSQRNIVVTVPFAAAIGGRRGAGPVTSAGGSVEVVTGSAHIGAVPPQLHGAMAKVTSAVVTTQANSTQQRNKVITSLPATFLTNANRTIDIAKTKLPAALNITRDKTPTPPPALVKPVVNGGVAPIAQQNLTTTVRILTPTIVKCTRPTTAPTITPTILQSATLSAGVPDVNPERDNYNVDRITDCWKCGLVFDHRKDLLRHLKEHNIDLPYKCYLCDASYMTRSDSLKHILTSHVTDWNGLKRKNQIDDPTEFCQVVDNIVTQNFLNTEGEMFNIRVHDLKKLGFNDDLKPESDYVHRKVYCTLCPKRFWSLQDLRRHMRSHTGERPFECDVCSKRFTLKHSMMRHRRKHTSSEVLAARSQQHRNSPSVGDSLHTQSSSTPSDSDDEVSAADGAVRAGLPHQLHLQPQPTQRTAALCDDASSDGDDDDDDDYNNNSSSSIAAASSCNTQDLKSSLQNIAQAAMSKLSSKSVTPDIRTLAGALTASFDRRIGAGGKEKSTINSSVPGLVAAAPVQAPVLTAVQNPGSKLAVSIKQTPVENLPARGSDLLQSLLGVETSAIDKMLDSVTDSAAVILGVQNGGSK